MQIDIITLFPEMFRACPVSRSSAKRMQAEGRLYGGPFDESIVKKAIEKKALVLKIHNLRDWAVDKRGTVDDRPYGGGTGMLLRPEPIFRAVEAVKTPGVLRSKSPGVEKKRSVILLDAGGHLYNQQKATQLANLDLLILICGHYEGVDYRVHEYLADEVLSIGDYVLTGGEIPAMVIVDSIARLLPGVLETEATTEESFSFLKGQSLHACKDCPYEKNLLEYPQYTRPESFRDHKVPGILLSGNHQKIEKWRIKKALERTKKNRPDLLET